MGYWRLPKAHANVIIFDVVFANNVMRRRVNVKTPLIVDDVISIDCAVVSSVEPKSVFAIC